MNIRDVRARVDRLDKKLLVTDRRFNGSVFLAHRDGGHFFWNSAFVEIWKSDPQSWAVVFTEHHGPHVYDTEDVLSLRAYSRISLIKVVEGWEDEGHG